jgi:hypothetical protein
VNPPKGQKLNEMLYEIHEILTPMLMNSVFCDVTDDSKGALLLHFTDQAIE